MRLNYSDDEDFSGQFALWRANCDRSVAGKRGQAALRRLEAALVAMPDKRLIRETLQDDHANVCALGALARHEGCLGPQDFDSDVEEFGESVLKFPRMVAWAVVAENDMTLDYEYRTAEGPSRYYYDAPGISVRIEVTPEERYTKMLAWVRAQLKSSEVNQ